MQRQWPWAPSCFPLRPESQGKFRQIHTLATSAVRYSLHWSASGAQVYVFPLTISSALCTAHSDKHLSASLCLAQPCPRSALWSMCARLGNPLTSYTEDHGAKQGRGQIGNKLPPQSHRNVTLQGPPGLSFAILSMLKNHHKTLLKQSAPTSKILIQWLCSGAQESAFLTRFQVMLTRLLQGPQTKEHVARYCSFLWLADFQGF